MLSLGHTKMGHCGRVIRGAGSGSFMTLSVHQSCTCATVAMVGLKDEAHCIICAAHKFGEHDYDLKFNVMRQTNCS